MSTTDSTTKLASDAAASQKRLESLFAIITGLLIMGAFAAPFIDQTFAALVHDPNWRRLVYYVVSVAILVFGLVLFIRRYSMVALVMNYMVLVLFCAMPLLPIVIFAADDRALLMKAGAVLFFAFLPGWLYLQFVGAKGNTLQEEYILNLFRLHMDDYRNLPKPPRESLYHEQWEKSRGARSDLDRKEDKEGKGEETKNIYLKKFQGVYGTDKNSVPRENYLPVLFTTLLVSVGWVAVLQPEVTLGLHLPVPTGSVVFSALPGEALSFGFVGSYFFILQMLVRRYFQDDLKTNAYINATIRIIVVALIVVVVDVVWPLSTAQMKAFAFLVGVFPQIGIQALQALITLPLKNSLIPTLHTDYPLSDLDGLNIWYESRLMEEGIENMQNLATANLVDLMLRTRVPMDRLIDWVDQAYLFLHVRKNEANTPENNASPDRETLRHLGIRTATDLQNACTRPLEYASQSPEEQDQWNKFSASLRKVLNPQSAGSLPNVVDVILSVLEDETNLYHVRSWKTYRAEIKKRSQIQLSGENKSPSSPEARILVA